MTARASKANAEAVLARHRSASHEYHLLARWEAGIVLTGSEVKSARTGKVNLKEGYVRIRNGEVYLHGVHFSPYAHSGGENLDPVRERKLLLHAAEIRKLAKETESGGMTIIPTRLYLKRGRIKIEIALARGKKLYDKREAKRRRDVDREVERAGAERTRLRRSPSRASE